MQQNNNIQFNLFEDDKSIVSSTFTPKSRGEILNESIWHQLDIHSKINLRSHWNTPEGRFEINYYCLENWFKSGFDLTPHIIESHRNNYYFLNNNAARKIKLK